MYKKGLLENTLLSHLLGSESSSPAGRASGLSRVPEDLKADPFLSGDFFFFFPVLGRTESSGQAFWERSDVIRPIYV